VSTLLNGDLLSNLPLLVSLHYLEKDEPQKFGLFGHTVYIPIIRLIRLAISSTFINQF